MSTPRVLLAEVYDEYSVDKSFINISLWHFAVSRKKAPYGYNATEDKIQSYKSINIIIEHKVQFVSRLFSEMGGVRRNAIHIAVMFIDGYDLTYEDRMNVAQVLEQQETNIKIFTVLKDVKYESKIVYLRDTIIVGYSAVLSFDYTLIMPICNLCIQQWWQFEHTHGSYSLSCYLVMQSYLYFDDSMLTCDDNYGASFVGIDSRNELMFLQNKIFSYLDGLSNLRKNIYPARLGLNLFRDDNVIVTRFAWKLLEEKEFRSNVINHWLPGKPSGESWKRAAMWQFERRENINQISNDSQYQDDFVDGWVDVGSRDLSTLTLCEISLPRRIDEDTTHVYITPATNESFDKALKGGGFVKYKSNIVSVSFNFKDVNFAKFLEQTDYRLFPLFDCELGADKTRYISYSMVCDSFNDCNNNRDEGLCWKPVTETSDLYKNKCDGIYCCDGYCLPWRWVNDGQEDCPVCDKLSGKEFNDESVVLHKHLQRNETCAFICNDDKCVHFSQLNDGHVDCTGWEGPLDETIGKLETADTCYNQHGHRIWAPRCVYVRDRYDFVIGCRDMSHLENCTDFECPVGYFKCPDAYCIPQHYVLDGKLDCQTVEDEQIDTIVPCSGNVACWDSKVCLHPDLVCNGHPDCPHRDDEMDCALKCVEGFRCLSGTVTVSSYNKSIPLDKFPSFDSETRYMDMSGVSLFDTNFDDAEMPKKTVVIKWSNCQIGFLDHDFFYKLYFLQEVDFSYNHIQIIDGRNNLFPESMHSLRLLNLSYNKELVFVKYLKFAALETLDLSHTSLTHLDASFLEEFPILTTLDISYTFIINFQNIFTSSLNLQTLDLRGLSVDNFYTDFFNGLSISQHLYTDNFELCCPQITGDEIPDYTCHGPVEAISSCFDLIGLKVQRVLLWVVTLLATLGSMLIIVYGVIWDRSSLLSHYELVVTSLGISDFIAGVYLFIIVVADYYYRDVYVLYDKTWRESIACRLAGFLATLSSESSIFFIFSKTVDIFFIIKFPFWQIKFSETGTIIAMLFSWIIAFILAMTPIVFKYEINSSNAMCIGLPLTTERLSGWEFSFSVFIVINIFLSLIITYGLRVTSLAISDNKIGRAESKACSTMDEHIIVVKQLSLVALSNLLCWFPIGIMGLLSLGRHEINNDVYAWTTVIVHPIKSAANPFLCMIPVLKDKWERFRYGRSRS